MSGIHSELRTLAAILEQAAKSMARLAEHLESLPVAPTAAEAPVRASAPVLPALADLPVALPELDPAELPLFEDEDGLRVIDLDARFAALAPPPVLRDRPPPPPPPPAPALLAEPVADAAPVPELEPDPGPERDWDALVEAAVQVLNETPGQRWEAKALARELRDRGASVGSLRGLYAGLQVRLRARADVEERGGKLSMRVARAGAEDWPWEQIVQTAVRLLEAEPDRRWRQAELGRAVKDAGVPIQKLQGMHFGLTARLRALGRVQEEDGLLFLERGGAGAAAPPAQPAAPAPPRVFLRKRGEETLSVVPKAVADAPAPEPVPA